MENPISQERTYDLNDPQLTALERQLLQNSEAMVHYAITAGKTLDPQYIDILSQIHQTPPDQWSAQDLLPTYNYLVRVVKPARPSTLVLFDDSLRKKSWLNFLGPIPIVQNFTLVALLSLIGMIGFSLFPEVNGENIRLSMLEDSGLDQLLRLAFLICAAGVGSSFSALFKMNKYISLGTFDTKYYSSYSTRLVLGLVSGLLLSELFVAGVETNLAHEEGASQLSQLHILLKPIMAIVGGYSAGLVHNVLLRLITTLERLFQVENKEDEKQKELNLWQERRNQVTHQLYQLKETLSSPALTSQEAVGQVNDLINYWVGQEPQPQDDSEKD